MASPLILIPYGFGLFFGWHTDSPLKFHLIYAALVLIPAIGTFIFAFSGCSPASQNNFTNIANWIGTIGCCLISVILLAIYLTALFSWHGLLTWDLA